MNDMAVESLSVIGLVSGQVPPVSRVYFGLNVETSKRSDLDSIEILVQTS